MDERKSIGLKRNKCCELATGDIITTLDDDDWSAPTRFAHQVQLLLDKPRMVMAVYTDLIFADRLTREAWQLKNSGGCGTSMTYWRWFWEQRRFTNKQIGEDKAFEGYASRARKLIAVPAGRQQVS